jgi:NAD(P)-dependent dehydrogenase (short-subunit alcohol dehydrogenase family)
MADVSKAVLITGCSSGIGHATAERLAGSGWTVYATARRPESISDLDAKGCKTLACDVTDEASMAAAVKAVEDAEGAVGVLVNNAGYSQSGAIESVPLDKARAQFETNVFGLIHMCQLALPGMRRFNSAVAKETAGVYEGPLKRLGGGPDVVANAIEKAITKRRPRTRYPVTPSARLALAQRKLMTDRMWDRAMRTQFPSPGRS